MKEYSWIAVTPKSMPDSATVVLVTVRRGKHKFLSLAWYSNIEECWYDGYEDKKLDLDVLAWMLPEPFDDKDADEMAIKWRKNERPC